jgi:hypothetical protein
MQAAEVGDAQRALRGWLHLGLVTTCLSTIAAHICRACTSTVYIK